MWQLSYGYISVLIPVFQVLTASPQVHGSLEDSEGTPFSLPSLTQGGKSRWAAYSGGYWQTLHRIQRHTRHSFLNTGSQPGPSRGLSLMSSQGSVDSDHLGKLMVGVEDPKLITAGLRTA